MDSRVTKMCTLFAVCFVSMMLYGRVAMGQVGCTTALMSLSPCLSYISGTSPTPGSSCCTQLQNVVKTQASCLCQVMNSTAAASFGASFNQTQALQLPGACKVETPPVSQCNAKQTPGTPAAATSPVGSPTSSPADALSPAASVTPDSPTTPTTPTVSSIPSKGTGSGSKSSTKNTSAGNMNKFPMQLTLLLLVLTSTVSAIITI